MRGPLPWILAAVGVIAVIVVGAAIGGRDDSGEVVPAGEWTQSVCGAIGVWRGELEDIVNDVRDPNAQTAAGSEEPQSETPQGRTGFIRKGLERAVEAADTLVVGIDDAGIPDTPEGEQAAETVSDWADSAQKELEDAQDSLDEEADSLEAGDRAAHRRGAGDRHGAGRRRADDRRGHPSRSRARPHCARRRAPASSSTRRRAG